MDKTCGNCKYRGEEITRFDDEELEDVGTGYFPCDRIRHRDVYCERGTGAHVVDGSDYFAQLRVENDFGCVKWEQK